MVRDGCFCRLLTMRPKKVSLQGLGCKTRLKPR
ncbi:hypothetical protein BVIR_937 [Blastochloris viridis]|nr:hypothetical protein BVIR_937 [Blastochloris viridis]